MRLIENKDLKKYILTHYDQVTIFATYLEIPETEINYCLQNKSYTINNPRREDNRPSLGFIPVLDRYTNLYKLMMKDWANTTYCGDCFDLVGIIRSLNSKDSSDFITICKDIIHTMDNRTVREAKPLTLSSKYDIFTSIHIQPRLWNKKDIALWTSFGLPFNEHQHLIFPLQNSFISNYCDYTYDEQDPGYGWISGYYDGQTLYTLYFPYRTGKEKHKPRFKKNNKFYPLENIHELKPADILVITKAYKEKLLITRLLYRLNTEHTIQVSNFTSESIVLSDEFVRKLYDIYPNVVTNTDFDLAGLKISRQHKQRFGMTRFVPTNGRYGTYDFGGKDLCNIHTARGEDYCIDIMQEAYNYLKYEIELENNINL